MLSEGDIVARVDHLTVTRFRVWVRQGWIRPATETPAAFSETDLARASLIRDLEDELGFGEEDVPVLLSLIDQIHGLRSELRCLLEAFDGLPDEVRATVRTQVSRRRAR